MKNFEKIVAGLVLVFVVVLIGFVAGGGFNFVKKDINSKIISQIDSRNILGTFNKQKIIASDFVKDIFKSLNEKRSRYDQEIKEETQKINNEASEINKKYKNNKKKIDEEMKKLYQKQEVLNQKMKKYNDEIQKEAQELSKQTDEKIKKSIDGIREKHNIKAMFDINFIYCDGKDYTEEIIKNLK